MVRAKFVCLNKKEEIQSVWDEKLKDSRLKKVYSYQLRTVYGNNPENEAFFASTPSGAIELSIVRDDLFEPGQEYYVDLTPAENQGPA